MNLEKAVNHGDTANTARSKSKKRFLVFRRVAVSPWLMFLNLL
jgi:hypothetical protein